MGLLIDLTGLKLVEPPLLILACQTGGDAPSTATITAAQTLIALITLPVTLTLLR